MRSLLTILLSCSLASCGLENFFSNETHSDYPRPTSALSGAATWNGADKAIYFAVDADYNEVTPFKTSYDAKTSTYQMNLPSSQYTWLIAQARSGNMLLSDIVPEIGEETLLKNVNFDARSTTETLIVVARLSADGLKMKTLTPAVYLGTRAVIQASMDVPGPSQDLLHMVERVMAKADKDLIGGDPGFFNLPVYDDKFKVKSGAIDPSFIARHPVDLDADGIDDVLTAKFDAKLGEAAKAAPSPAGCLDPTRIRIVFTVDFNTGSKDGNCNTVDKFKWAVDKPGKRMFFVGWVHLESEVQDPAVNSMLGASTPNTIPMYDDGTNGDEVAGDNVWTVYFDVPRDPSRKLRIGYKYTWGLRGQVWTGSEEWPGNSRIIEVVDDNGDGMVYRHDVWGDEATNKDRSNLNLNGNGSITWTTDLHACGTPESHENGWDDNSCKCKPVLTPKAIGPINRACNSP